jgi:hypothetical protein
MIAQHGKQQLQLPSSNNQTLQCYC